MSAPILACALWVLAATIVALLPVRRQRAPGLALLVVAPVLILWLGAEHGWGWPLAALLVLVSMFRHPLRWLWRKARGRERAGP